MRAFWSRAKVHGRRINSQQLGRFYTHLERNHPEVLEILESRASAWKTATEKKGSIPVGLDFESFAALSLNPGVVGAERLLVLESKGEALRTARIKLRPRNLAHANAATGPRVFEGFSTRGGEIAHETLDSRLIVRDLKIQKDLTLAWRNYDLVAEEVRRLQRQNNTFLVPDQFYGAIEKVSRELNLALRDALAEAGASVQIVDKGLVLLIDSSEAGLGFSRLAFELYHGFAGRGLGFAPARELTLHPRAYGARRWLDPDAGPYGRLYLSSESLRKGYPTLPEVKKLHYLHEQRLVEQERELWEIFRQGAETKLRADEVAGLQRMWSSTEGEIKYRFTTAHQEMILNASYDFDIAAAALAGHLRALNGMEPLGKGFSRKLIATLNEIEFLSTRGAAAMRTAALEGELSSWNVQFNVLAVQKRIGGLRRAIYSNGKVEVPQAHWRYVVSDQSETFPKYLQIGYQLGNGREKVLFSAALIPFKDRAMVLLRRGPLKDVRTWEQFNSAQGAILRSDLLIDSEKAVGEFKNLVNEIKEQGPAQAEGFVQWLKTYAKPAVQTMGDWATLQSEVFAKQAEISALIRAKLASPSSGMALYDVRPKLVELLERLGTTRLDLPQGGS